MRVDRKLWIGVAAGLTFVQVAACALLPRGFALTAVSDYVCAALMLALILACARNAAASHGRLRSVWILQSLCWALWLADQCGWTLYDIVLRRPLPEMFPGDVLLFLAMVPMLAALLLRPHLMPSARSIRLGLLDFFQLMGWWIYIYVYFVMCWQYVSENSALYDVNFDRLYLLEYLLLLSVISLLLKQSRGEWKRFYAYFLGAALLNCLSVMAENRAIELKTYYNGSWYDIPFMVSFALFMVVAVTGRDLAPELETAEDQRYSSGMATLSVVAVLSLPVIVVIAVTDRSEALGIVHFRVILTAIVMFVLAVLAFVKQRRLHEDLKQTNKTLEEASMTDPLTGIRNRRFFSTTVEGDVAQTLRAYAASEDRSTRDMVFYLIDLDNFKEVNDLYGHDAGDRVLIETTRRIQSAIRETDVLLRWGGEEFLVISRATDRRRADALALRMMLAVRGDPFEVNVSTAIRRTCSIGWAAFPWREDKVDALGYEEVLNLADRALGQAKEAGKDQAIGMTPSQGEARASASIRPDTVGPSTQSVRPPNAADLHFSGLI